MKPLKWERKAGSDKSFKARGPGRHYFLLYVSHARTYWQAVHVNNGHVMEMSDLKEGPEGQAALRRWCAAINRKLSQ